MMQDLRQTPQFAQYLESLGWKVIRYQVSGFNYQVFLKKLPIIGNIAKLQRPTYVNFKAIWELVKRERVAVLYLEPSTEPDKSTEISFQSARGSFLPAKTIIIDLTKSENELLENMRPKTRYNIKLAQKKGVEISVSQDIQEFINLWHSSAQKRGMWLSQKQEIEGLFKIFKNKAKLLLAYKDQELLGGILLTCSINSAFYMYAGSSKTGKQLFVPTLLAWEAIKIAKQMELKYFDFEGIYDKRYSQTNRWKGFSRFKEGFGGQIIEYPKTLVYFQNPLLRFLNF